MSSYWSKTDDKLGLATNNRKLKTDTERGHTVIDQLTVCFVVRKRNQGFLPYEVDSYTKVLGIRIPRSDWHHLKFILPVTCRYKTGIMELVTHSFKKKKKRRSYILNTQSCHITKGHCF